MNTLLEKSTQVNRTELEMKVKSMYKKVALHPEKEYHFEMGRPLAERLGYPGEILDKIPGQAIESFAGVGHFFDLAELQEGEYVVDLGSGSGMDVFCAALQVGKTGEVIGIDMTDDQLKKSALLRDLNDFGNVIFHKGYIEQLPVVDESVDVVISNGVVNLSSDKEQVFREASRILRPGGRLVIADIVSKVQLPENIKCNATLWAACIGGAMQEDEYLNMIESAGLNIVEVKENPYAFISNGAKGATKDYGIKSISINAVKADFNPIY